MRFLVVWVSLMLGGCVSATDSDLTTEQRDARVKAQTTLAISYISNGNFDLALAPLARALELDPQNPEAMLAQAALLQRQGDSDQAQAAYDDMLRVNPNFSRGRQNYAAFLFDQGQLDAACDEFGLVVQDVLYANRAQAFENLGACRKMQGRSAESLAAYQRSYVLDQSRPLPNLVLAESSLLAGEYAQSRVHFTNFLRGSSQSARSLWVGIRLANAIGDLDSQASYELLLRNRFPNSAEYAEWLEWTS